MRQSDFITKHTATVDLKGFSHFLSGQAPIGEVLNSTDYENLYVIFSGVYPPNPTELLTSKVFADFVAEAKENFDFVIIDTPPLGLVSDAAVCIAQSDGVALVVSSGKTSLKKAKEVKFTSFAFLFYTLIFKNNTSVAIKFWNGYYLFAVFFGDF